VQLAGVTLRRSTTADTGYRIYYNQSTLKWEIHRRVAGADTLLASLAQTLVVTNTYTLMGRIFDVAATSILQVAVSGSRIMTVTDSSPVTAAGRPGVVLNSSAAPTDSIGLQLDNFVSDDAAFAAQLGLKTRGTFQANVRGPQCYPLGFNLGNTRHDIYYWGAGVDAVNGSPSPPSYQFQRAGLMRFPWKVNSGTRTLSVNVMQPVNTSPRPTLTVRASSDLGVNSDVVASAGSSTGWVTIGPVTVTPTSNGVLWVEIACSTPGMNVPCNFDHFVAT
jgi:hypothetical protein